METEQTEQPAPEPVVNEFKLTITAEAEVVKAPAEPSEEE